MSKPMLLDLFCKAGGAGMGYHRAGFRVVGVDHEPQKRYPFEFVQADALEFCRDHGGDFDVIHASPPCQAHSAVNRFADMGRHQDLIPETRTAVSETGRPWVIENVEGAPLRPAICLCGQMFGLKVFRHRLFESSCLLLQPSHPGHRCKFIGVDGMVCVAGNGGAGTNVPARLRSKANGVMNNKATWSKAMGIGWMSMPELAQAVPPAYTEYLGRQLLHVIRNG